MKSLVSALPLAAALVAACTFTASPARAQDRVLQPGGSVDETAPATPRYPPSSVRWKLITGGAFVTTAAWGIGFAAASVWPEVPGSTGLKIPVAGPWIALAQSGCAPGESTCGVKLALRSVGYIVSGIAQLGGLALIGEGIFATTEAQSPKRRPTRAFTVTPTPLVTGSATGIGVVGTF